MSNNFDYNIEIAENYLSHILLHRNYKNKDTLLMLESLPARETRNYIKLVLTNLWVYKTRLNQDNSVLLSLASGKSINSKLFFKNTGS